MPLATARHRKCPGSSAARRVSLTLLAVSATPRHATKRDVFGAFCFILLPNKKITHYHHHHHRHRLSMDINEDNHEAAAVSVGECGIRREPSKKWWSPANTTDGCFDCNICLDSAHDPVVTLCGHLYCWPCIYKWLHRKGDDDDDDPCRRRCPVCKACLSESMMVPLYGHGGDRLAKSSSDESGSHTDVDIPQRPSPSMSGTTQITLDQSISVDHHRHSRPRQRRWDSFYNDREPPPMLSPGLFRPSATSMMGPAGGTAFLVLPWVFGCPAQSQRPVEPQHSPYPYHLVGGAISAGDRRQMRREAASVRSLQRISAFLVCCLIMCLLMF